MKWKEKIRQMNDDELAEFLTDFDSDKGFMNAACLSCPYHKNEYECDANGSECKTAVIQMLERESNFMRTAEEIRCELDDIRRRKKEHARKIDECEARMMELADELSAAVNEENRHRRSEAVGDV